MHGYTVAHFEPAGIAASRTEYASPLPRFAFPHRVMHADAMGESRRFARAVPSGRRRVSPVRLARSQLPRLGLSNDDWPRPCPRRHGPRLLRLADESAVRPVRSPAHGREPARALLHGVEGLPSRAGA